jgi:hypothetical protein
MLNTELLQRLRLDPTKPRLLDQVNEQARSSSHLKDGESRSRRLLLLLSFRFRLRLRRRADANLIQSGIRKTASLVALSAQHFPPEQAVVLHGSPILHGLQAA